VTTASGPSCVTIRFSNLIGIGVHLRHDCTAFRKRATFVAIGQIALVLFKSDLIGILPLKFHKSNPEQRNY
jgi:hypothetical protein